MTTETMTTETASALTAIKTLPKSHWRQSYTGKAGRCCCGCAGNYSENPRALTAQINRITRLIETGEAENVMIYGPEAEPEFISVEANERMYTLYNRA
jgi:hypothetical protein